MHQSIQDNCPNAQTVHNCSIIFVSSFSRFKYNIQKFIVCCYIVRKLNKLSGALNLRFIKIFSFSSKKYFGYLKSVMVLIFWYTDFLKFLSRMVLLLCIFFFQTIRAFRHPAGYILWTSLFSRSFFLKSYLYIP